MSASKLLGVGCKAHGVYVCSYVFCFVSLLLFGFLDPVRVRLVLPKGLFL